MLSKFNVISRLRNTIQPVVNDPLMMWVVIGVLLVEALVIAALLILR
jgi:hypothetical protein